LGNSQGHLRRCNDSNDTTRSQKKLLPRAVPATSESVNGEQEEVDVHACTSVLFSSSVTQNITDRKVEGKPSMFLGEEIFDYMELTPVAAKRFNNKCQEESNDLELLVPCIAALMGRMRII
jgi:hypothetical protein